MCFLNTSVYRSTALRTPAKHLAGNPKKTSNPLPVLYIIENNQYGMGTSIARASAQTEFFRHGEGLGIPGIQCDGMNVLSVRDATLEASSFVRAGNGPMIIEMNLIEFLRHYFLIKVIFQIMGIV